MMLPSVSAPLLERHSWRQVDTASFARGLARGDFDVLHPKFLAYYPDAYGIDGATETEFNLYPLIVSFLLRLFGERDVLARLVSLCFSLATGIWTYLLGRRLLGNTAGMLAGVMLALSPLFVFYGRSVQPDATALSLSVGALYCFLLWLDGERTGWYVASLVMIALALLTKITTLYMGIPLLLAAWSARKGKLFSDWRIWVYGLGALAPAIAYYAYARSLYYETGLTVYGLSGGWPGSGKFDNLGQLLSVEFYRIMFARLRSVIIGRYPLALAFLGVLIVPRKREAVLYGWLLAMGLFILAAAQGNRQHEYYQLPLVPILALFAGKCLSELLRPGVLKLRIVWPQDRVGLLIGALVLLLSLRSVPAQLAPRLGQASILAEVARATRQYTSPEAPVAIIHDWARVPEVFYYADRRGWSLWLERTPEGKYGRLIVAERQFTANGWQIAERLEDDISRLDLLRAQGAASLVVSLEKGTSKEFAASRIAGLLAQRYRLIASDEHWLIYDLGEPLD